MKKVRLTEADLTRLVRRVIKEQGWSAAKEESNRKDPTGWIRREGFWESPALTQEQTNHIKSLNMDKRIGYNCKNGSWKISRKDNRMIDFVCSSGKQTAVILPKPVDSDPNVRNGNWGLSRRGLIFMYDK
jgi:hypothetical protein